jgi:hypothetical protein
VGILIGVIAVAPIWLVLRVRCRCFAGNDGSSSRPARRLAGTSTLEIRCPNLEISPFSRSCKLSSRDRNPIRLAGEEIVR